MSEMNGDDMDDLFQKAGEKYPLRTDNADWEAVSSRLGESNPSIYALPADLKKRVGKRKYLMMAALLLLVLACYYGIYSSGHGLKSEPRNQISSKKLIKEDNPGTGVKEQMSFIIPDNKKYSTENEPANLNKEKTLASGFNKVIGSRVGKYHDREKGESSNSVDFIMPEFHSLLQVVKPDVDYAGRIVNSDIFDKSKNKPEGQVQNPAGKSPSVIASRKSSKFYAGIIVAPDISMVKFQSVKGIGFSVGLLAGYKISKKISIETGVQLDVKDYYSEGEYFDKQNIPNLGYSDLINIKGNCKMIEVPLNLRYNFHQSLKNDWFITTGFSSYFMFRESYDYNYMHYGIQKAGYYATAKPSQYWFSVFNIGIGYEHQVGKIGSVRVEPYLKSPLAGMGTGSLPIMSAGVNLGIVHRF